MNPQSYHTFSNKWFTLIEVLIVIVIIWVLAVALVPRIKWMQDQVRYTRVEKDFQDFRTAVFMAQSNTNQNLYDITWRIACIRCSCDGNTDLSVLASNHPCRNHWIQALRRIEQAAGLHTGALAGMETDPWGSPYLFDTDEWEPVHGCSRQDRILSAGPDKNHQPFTSPDNRRLMIRPSTCPGGY